jgi:hypothetical protein
MQHPSLAQNPDLPPFGGGSSETILHPIVLAFLLLVILSFFLLPRRRIVFPLLLGLMLVPLEQNLNLGGLHLFVYRVLLLAGWMRALISWPSAGNFLPGGFQLLDKIFIVWALYRALALALLFGQVGAVINQIAFIGDALGTYFLLRTLLRSIEEVDLAVKAFAVIAICGAVAMCAEHKTGQYLTGYLRGTSLPAELRNGRVRAKGVFGHPILAGCFGAVNFFLQAWLWKRGTAKVLSVLGLGASVIMVVTSVSSTPMSSILGGMMAVSLFPLRRRMRELRWGLVALIACLGMVMKAPVWYLLARIDLSGGSKGWDRAFLIDSFVNHVSDWWLIGTRANSYWGWDMWDKCNQFVCEGESGGMVCLICFIAFFVICFGKSGAARKAAEGDRQAEWLYWLTGTIFYVQLLGFMGVDIFDQSKLAWWTLLAMISVMARYPLTAAQPTPQLLPHASRLNSIHTPPRWASVHKPRPGVALSKSI